MFMKNRNKKLIIFSLLLAAGVTLFYGETAGEKAFKENKPQQAVILLEQELANGSASLDAWNYLGLAYYQLENYTKAIETFATGLKTTGTKKKVLSFNQGNAYYAIKEYVNAAKSYSLAYTVDPSFTRALLNRANANLMAKEFDAALEDYENYIALVADDPQRNEIIAIIEALKKDKVRREEDARLAALEAERLAEEEARLAEEMERQRKEEERLAEEARLKREAEEAEARRVEELRRAEEAERRRKMLEEVANSLQQTDSTNMSAGTEDLIDYDTEGELD